MFVLLHMNVEDAINAVITVAKAVFPEGSHDRDEQETNSKIIREAIEDLLQTRGIPLDTKLYEKDRPPGRCKVFVYLPCFSCRLLTIL